MLPRRKKVHPEILVWQRLVVTRSSKRRSEDRRKKEKPPPRPRPAAGQERLGPVGETPSPQAVTSGICEV